MAAAAGVSHSSRRAHSINEAPASASPSANSAPRPREPPVTIATRPDRSKRDITNYNSAPMRACVLTATGDPSNLKIEQRPDLHAGPGEAIVRLRAAALNHRDVWIRKGQYAGIKVPIILGSDGAGVVAEVGDGVDASWV